MPPCHGGDRRFESGRARQEKNPTYVGSFSWGDRFEPQRFTISEVVTTTNILRLVLAHLA